MTASTADAIINETRCLQAAAYRVMLDPALDTAGRRTGMQRLLDRARTGVLPELCCRAVERGLVDVIFGRHPEARFYEALTEAAVRRDLGAA